MSSDELPALISFLSGIDAVTLLEIIHTGMSCESEADFVSLFPTIRELFPFDFAGVLLGNRGVSQDPVISHGVNASFPEEWVREYLQPSLYQVS
jgi:hypothetical protein